MSDWAERLEWIARELEEKEPLASLLELEEAGPAVQAEETPEESVPAPDDEEFIPYRDDDFRWVIRAGTVEGIDVIYREPTPFIFELPNAVVRDSYLAYVRVTLIRGADWNQEMTVYEIPGRYFELMEGWDSRTLLAVIDSFCTDDHLVERYSGHM